MSNSNVTANDQYKDCREKLFAAIDDINIDASDIDADLVTGYLLCYNRYFKRIIDLVLAILLFSILWPIYFLIAAAIFIEDGAPIFYRAQRGGLHNLPFRIFKFRTMVKNADKIGGGTTALNDNRITKTGKLLRKIKVDEFANLLSIIKGDMSFIGPRPELLRYTNQYQGTEKLILEVRPGITDYSSVEFINLDEIVGSDNADEMYEKYVLPKKNELRIKYAATVSFRTDVYLFILTVWKVIEKAIHVLFGRKQHKIGERNGIHQTEKF